MLIKLERARGFMSDDDFYELLESLFEEKFYFSDLYYELTEQFLDDFAAALDNPILAQADPTVLYDAAFEDFHQWAMEEFGEDFEHITADEAEFQLRRLYVKQLALDAVARYDPFLDRARCESHPPTPKLFDPGSFLWIVGSGKEGPRKTFFSKIVAWLWPSSQASDLN